MIRMLASFLVFGTVASAANAQSVGVGGALIPQAVKDVISTALKTGALAYDVRETKNNGEFKWTPYGVTATAPNSSSMSFAYTEVTPQKIAADVADQGESTWMVITRHPAPNPDDEVDDIAYVKKKGGTGNIS